MERTPKSRASSLSVEAEARLKKFKAYSTAHTIVAAVDKQLSRAIEEPAGFAYILLYGPSGVGKTTLIRQIEQRHHPPATLTRTPPPVPLILLEARPPDGATFNREEYYRSALKELGEETYERRTLVNLDGEHVWEQKKRTGKAAKFNDSAELRRVYEDALQRRGVHTIILDEAQHLLKLASGIKVLDQLDWLKSLTNTTGVLHILTGTYELLPLRKLNGQTARRGLEVHFPRYQYQHEPDQRDFQGALLTLLQQVPLQVEIGPLLQQWPYFYERSIGCIGVLKDWLVRTVASSLKDNLSSLLFERIQECALPIAPCESMAMEAASGEQELHYTASHRQHLWELLGMSIDTTRPKEPPALTPDKPTNARIGTPQVTRYEVGEQKKPERAEKCGFSGSVIALVPAQLEQKGITKAQCPECGAVWKAHVRGETITFPTHQPPLKVRSSALPRWIRQGAVWSPSQ